MWLLLELDQDGEVVVVRIALGSPLSLDPWTDLHCSRTAEAGRAWSFAETAFLRALFCARIVVGMTDIIERNRTAQLVELERLRVIRL